MPHEAIVILGTPRSGTTLLRRLLDAHADIDAPGETHLLAGAARFLHSETTPQGVGMGVVPGLKLLGFPEDLVHQGLRELVFGFHGEHARQQGKSRFAIKTAIDSFYLKELEPLLVGHAHIVCIVRHGLDVVASMDEMTRETGAFLTELHHYVQQTPWPLEAYARAWSDITEGLTGLAERHPDGVTLLRYEDLVEDPDTHLRTLLETLGAPWDDTLVQRALATSTSVGLGDWKTYRQAKTTRSSVDRWKKLPQPALERLVPIVRDQLQRHGYEVPDLHPPDDEKLDRRTRLAMMLNLAKRGDSAD